MTRGGVGMIRSRWQLSPDLTQETIAAWRCLSTPSDADLHPGVGRSELADRSSKFPACHLPIKARADGDLGGTSMLRRMV